MNFEIAQSYIFSLTGDINSVVDFRCIHDTRKDIAAHHFTGTLRHYWQTLCNYNADGYGIFCNINPLDGQGRELANVAGIRAHVIDLDNLLTAQQNYERAINSNPIPTFAVQSSPGKYHVYWIVEPYVGNDFYTLHQRKLRQFYDGDKSVIDPTRVLRVPGFYHLKNPQQPFMVQIWALNGYGRRIPVVEIQTALAQVNVIDGGGSRHKLGDPDMSAPSLDWLQKSLSLVNPNDLERGEWISLTAAIKQAGWLHADEQTLFKIWSEWCAQYSKNDLGENLKQWNSIRDTEVGWPALQRKTPINAYLMFDKKTKEANGAPITDAADAINKSKKVVNFKDIVSGPECEKYFKNCYFIGRMGKIFTPHARFMNATEFNGYYGGKHFIISSTGKTTDEPWKAALRSTEWTIPKVDHVRFLPDKNTFDIVEDEMGRNGLNTYIPVKIDAKQGDVTLWKNHIAKILPNERDQTILYQYLAHVVKYPGYKIPWAPLIQSAEGVGKTVIQEAMSKILGGMYTYFPKADQLVKSGNTFNAWIRNKLLIMVNEIKIDEKRELIEILKPLISDARIEIQGKGVDQEMEDNIANWLFFSNFKDAMPIGKDGRRLSIFFSQIQTHADLVALGMDDNYFNILWRWLRDEGGHQAIAYWLLNYPIEKGAISQRAPHTSSHNEALQLSQSPIEVLVADCVLDGLPGFRGGFVSVLAVMTRIKASGIRNPTITVVKSILAKMGYIEIGKANRAYMQEDVANKTTLYGIVSNLNLADYGRAQGYE